MKLSLIHYKNLIIIAILLTWLVGTLYAFWLFQFSGIQSFDEEAVQNRAVFFQSGELGYRLEKKYKKQQGVLNDLKTTTVVHFWNPDCLCSRFNDVHLLQVIDKYSKHGVNFEIVVHGETEDIRANRRQLALEKFNHPAVKNVHTDWLEKDGPSSSPAAAVMNEKGELVYFGPYSLGARCAPEDGMFIETVLDNLQVQKKVNKKQLNILAVGCFCSWNKMSS